MQHIVVFCTTCKGRLPHLEQTLPRNMADNPNAKFVVLDYGDPNGLANYMRTRQQAALESGRLSFYQYPTQALFHMTHAKNMAHRIGMLEGASVLCNLDADNYAGPGFAEYIADQFKSKEEPFLWARMIQGRRPRGISGRIATSVHAFKNVGGYDEKYATYSPDDEDFKARLSRIGYKGVEIDGAYLNAIRHGDKLRFREYRHAACSSEDELEALRKSDNTVVNYGRLGTGTVFKNFSPEPIPLVPLPTRIFGIGMHKTATTSLHVALQKLGHSSAHWVHPQWAKAVWDQMQTQGRSPALEQYYCILDLPINILYAQLDQAYPGSKFILTTRNEEAWLNSVRNHWSYESNPYRSWWDVSPFTQRIHRELYGRTDFNAEVFLARYRRHNAEVREYFKDRPGDLLVMNMSKGAGWKELCGFLNCKAPSAPYPIEFKTLGGKQ